MSTYIPEGTCLTKEAVIRLEHQLNDESIQSIGDESFDILEHDDVLHAGMMFIRQALGCVFPYTDEDSLKVFAISVSDLVHDILPVVFDTEEFAEDVVKYLDKNLPKTRGCFKVIPYEVMVCKTSDHKQFVVNEPGFILKLINTPKYTRVRRLLQMPKAHVEELGMQKVLEDDTHHNVNLIKHILTYDKPVKWEDIEDEGID